MKILKEIFFTLFVMTVSIEMVFAAPATVNDSIEIKISLENTSAQDFPRVRLDFIGKNRIDKTEDVAIDPEFQTAANTWRGGFLIELKGPSGQIIPFKAKQETIRVRLPEMKNEAFGIYAFFIYRKIAPGKFFSLDLPIAQWKKIHPKFGEDIKKLLNPQTSVSLKKSAGSTNPVFVKKQLAQWKKMLSGKK